MRAILFLTFMFLSGCSLPVQQLENSERGIITNNLPRFLGGGVSSNVVSGGKLAILMPWQTLVRIDTREQQVSLGDELGGKWDQYVFTRALDGNEVALKLVIVYHVSSDPKELVKLVQTFASSNEAIRDIVISITRAEVRSKLNELQTADFLKGSRFDAVKKAQDAVAKRLEPYGVKITDLILQRNEFARLQPDGTVETVYQERLNEIQRIREETERERLRIETVKAAGQEKFNQAQAEVNRLLEEAKGELEQAKARGEGFLKSKENEAKAILARGNAEVQGLKEKVSALAGEGGSSLVKLEIAKALKSSGSRFVVLGGGAQNMSVEKLDTNELMNTLGLIEGVKSNEKKE